MTKLSIIIPVYNGEKYIRECISSILINNTKDYEVIIINDGSTDNTQNILDELKNDKLKIYNNKNHGVSYSRNFGIGQAEGEYLMFVDADDILNRNWYDTVKEYFNYKYDIVIFSNEGINSNKEILMRQVAGMNKDGICIAGPFSKLYRKDFLKENNIVFISDLINGEDMIFNLSILKKTKNYKIVNNNIYIYRVNFGSATKSFNEKIIDTDRKFQKYLMDILDINQNNDKLIIQNSCINGIYTMFDRLSFVDCYTDVKKFYKRIDFEFYNKFFLRSADNNLGFFKNLVIYFIKNRRYFLAYKILRLKNKLIKLKRKEYLKEI